MATKVFISAILLTATILATLTTAQVDPIWLSPSFVGDYSAEFPELGVWSNSSIGAGARYGQPIVVMDSKKTLWILLGHMRTSNQFSVWNYDPKTDLYRRVVGPENSTTLQVRNPGELRVPSPDNYPGLVAYTPGTIDHNDNIWFMTTNDIGELWMFNTTSHYFTRMKGSSEETVLPVYGALGQPGDDVSPGAIQPGCLVVDSSNNLWQVTGAAFYGRTNRIWHFNTTSYQWTWMGGSMEDTTVQTTYGNEPIYGSRRDQSCDIDDDDRIWLFGGDGYTQGVLQNYNDVWSYDTRTLQWQLEFGSYATLQANATVTVVDDFDAGNHPAVMTFAPFVDRKDGTLLLVNSDDAAKTNGLWLFHKTLKQWKLIYGDLLHLNNVGNFSHYRTPGSVMPGYRRSPGWASGLNVEGDVFVYGGGNQLIASNDIWLIPHEQCATLTSNECSSNAQCIEDLVGYSCQCKDGFVGDGFTCESSAPLVSPNSPSSPSEEPSQSPLSATPLSSSQPSPTPHRNTRVSRGVTVELSLFVDVLSLVVFALGWFC